MKYGITLVLILSLLLTGCDNRPTTVDYDIIVVGSDPEAIAAALAAARSGAKTLLIDSREKLGGLFTLGWLNFLDMNYGPDWTLLTQGIFAEFFNQIEGISFNITTAEKVFNKMVAAEENVSLKLNAEDIKPVVQNNKLLGISAVIDDRKYQFNAAQVIDATQDCDIAAAAGVPFTQGQEDIGGPTYGMAVTQVFKLGGIKIEDWVLLSDYLNTDDDPESGASGNSIWGFARFYNDYQASQDNVQLRGLNLARQTDGCVMVNALQIFQIDPLSEQSKQLARQKALTELEHIIPFLKKEVPGMDNIELLAVAPELYIRESRHMQTEYRLTIDDVLENRDFSDRIALGSYPVDMQGTEPGQDVIIIGNPAQYAIPLRSIIPLQIENLLLASRSAGYDSLAHGSARMVPVGMCTGEAAGTAAVLALENKISVRELAKDTALVQQLQEKLIANGAYLPEFNIAAPITENPYYNGLKLLRKYGLIQGRYQNNYRLDDQVTIGEYSRVLNNLIAKDQWDLSVDYHKSESTEYLLKRNIEESLEHAPQILSLLNQHKIWSSLSATKPVTRGEMAQILYYCKLALS